MRKHGKDRGPTFYEAALTCGQSLWRQGLPAQAMLQINRAFGADVSENDEILETYPLPYAAMAWVMCERTEDQFIGNPRRHFQHLATRMVEPRKELRTWRAWACWWMSRLVFPDYPADDEQIENEGIEEPSVEQISMHLRELGPPGEVEIWLSVCDQLRDRK